jgi:uracil-DNA glycosylase
VRRLVIVGEAPGPSSSGPPDGQTWRRIARLAGVDDVAEIGVAANLLGFFPGPSAKGALAPRAAMRAAAAAFPLRRYSRALFLGWRVADAFCAARFGFPTARRVPLWWNGATSVPFAVLPHPSGVNHWWNDPKNRRRAARFLRAVAAENRTEKS